jgi:hypothetical protein
VWTDGEGGDDVSIKDKKHTVTIRDPQVEDLVPVPQHTLEFVDPQGRVPPVAAEQRKLRAGRPFQLHWQRPKLAFEPDGAA